MYFQIVRSTENPFPGLNFLELQMLLLLLLLPSSLASNVSAVDVTLFSVSLHFDSVSLVLLWLEMGGGLGIGLCTP